MEIFTFASITSNNLNEVVQPIISLINTAIPVLLSLVGAIGLIWSIVLGVKYAKAEDPQEHEKAKKALINAIVGFILIFVLLIMVEVGLEVFKSYWENYEYTLT